MNAFFLSALLAVSASAQNGSPQYIKLSSVPDAPRGEAIVLDDGFILSLDDQSSSLVFFDSTSGAKAKECKLLKRATDFRMSSDGTTFMFGNSYASVKTVRECKRTIKTSEAVIFGQRRTKLDYPFVFIADINFATGVLVQFQMTDSGPPPSYDAVLANAKNLRRFYFIDAQTKKRFAKLPVQYDWSTPPTISKNGRFVNFRSAADCGDKLFPHVYRLEPSTGLAISFWDDAPGSCAEKATKWKLTGAGASLMAESPDSAERILLHTLIPWAYASISSDGRFVVLQDFQNGKSNLAVYFHEKLAHSATGITK